MMKKKILSALTALCCAVGCCYCPAVFAEETLPSQEYIVIAVDNEEAPENFVIMNPDDPSTYLWLSATDIDRFLAEGEESVEFGDILLLEGEMIWTGKAGINSFSFVDENGEATDDAGCIYNTGSILDGSTETFTVTTYENASYDSLGEQKCYFNYIYSDGCIQPSCVDWSTVESGDSITCITYNGLPVLPVAVNAEPTLPTEEFVVIGVNNEEDPGVFIIMSMENKSHILRLPIRYTEQFMPEGEDSVEFGDILTLEGYLCCTEEVGLNTFCFVDIDDIDNDGDLQEQIGYIYNTGSVLNNETAVFTAGEVYGGVYRCLDDYWYYMMEDGFTQPGCIDLATVSTGDSVTCITYNGLPVLPVSVTHLGDFNTDGEINAMDATRILMAAAAAGAGTEAVSTASETAASPIGDVNADGEVNAMDATIVLVYAARNGAGAQVSVSEVATELME